MSRIPVAVIAGLVGFALYLAAALSLADAVINWHWALQAVYFVAAGTIWVFPIRWLMYWSVHQR